MSVIVIDGPDGSGKTSIAKSLVGFMNENRRDFGGLEAVYYKSPAEPFGSMCGKLDKAENLVPSARMLFFMAALHQDSAEIEKLVKSGKHVVMDRYWHTTLAFHTAMSEDVGALFNRHGLVKEDVSVLLSAPDEVLDARIKARSKKEGTDLSWWESQNFQRGLRRRFNDQASRDSNTLLLNTFECSVEQAVSAIIEKTRSVCNGYKKHGRTDTQFFEPARYR